MIYHSNLINDQMFWNYLENLYGKLTMDSHRWAARFVEQDIILFKLILALFTFSTNSRIFHQNIFIEYTNINHILQIQNKYAELTWKYLIYKYGYHQTIIKFINLIQWLLAITVSISHAHNIQSHVNDIQSLVQQIELTLVLDDSDRIVEIDN